MIRTTMGATRIQTFSARHLREARAAKGWSRGRLAAAVDMSVAAVIGWERGNRTPEPSTLVRLATALDVPPGDLLTIPRSEFGLVELRVIRGLQQQEVAAQLFDVTAERVSHIENAFERVPPALVGELAALYGTSPEEISAAWERGRARLTHS